MSHLLEALALKFGTDKSHEWHNYMPVYIDLIGHRKDDPITILELGTDKACRSTKMWEEYFTKGRIIGVDIAPEAKKHVSDRINILNCNLGKVDQVKNLKPQIVNLAPAGVDVIIDDASHFVSDIVLCFNELWDLVKPGGYYIIEDTTKAFWKERRGTVQGTLMKDYFCELLNALNGDGTPNIHNYTKFKAHNYPYGNDWTTRIEEVRFRAEMVIVKYREKL